VERLLPHVAGVQVEEAKTDETIIAPSRAIDANVAKNIKLSEVEILAILPGHAAALKEDETMEKLDAKAGDIVAVRQANCFGTSFHPELTGDPRIHVWWLEQVVEAINRRKNT
jgi:5'-phosphate synthase pdxT subunit